MKTLLRLIAFFAVAGLVRAQVQNVQMASGASGNITKPTAGWTLPSGFTETVASGATVNGAGTFDFSQASSHLIPAGASPTTTTFGQIAAANAAWAAGRGAVQFYDGTANTFLVGTLASSVPANGQVPQWATGGTISWASLITAPSGTSGGIPYYSSTTTLAPSGLLTTNALILGGGAGTAPAPLGSLGTTTTVLHGNASGAPSFGAVALGTDVSGTLPAGNGGTGNAFFAVAGPSTSTKTFTFPNASANVLTDNAAVTGAQGGTGVSNSGKTITIGGNFSTVGAFTTAITVGANTTVTLPASGTLVGSADTGTVTNTMLAGSIANAKLSNSSVTIGSTNVALGATVTTFAGVTLTSPNIGAATFTSLTQTTGGTITSTGTGNLQLAAFAGSNGSLIFTPDGTGFNKFNVASFFNGNIGLLNLPSTGNALYLNGDPGNASGTTTGIANIAQATSANITGAFLLYDAFFGLSGSSLVPEIDSYRANGGSIGTASVTTYKGYSANNHPVATNNYAFWSSNYNSGSGIWQLYMSGTADNYLNGNTLFKTTTDNSNGVLQIAASTVAGGGIAFGNDTPQASIYRSAASTLTTPAIWNVSNTTASTSTTTGSATFGGGIGVAGAGYFGGGLLSTGATQGVGYGTGAGGTVSQGTSRTTGVTLSKMSGDITLFTAAGSATPASFTVTNTAVGITDTIEYTVRSATNTYLVFTTNIAAGSFTITFYTTGGTASDTPIIHFNVVKGVNS